MLKKLIDTNIFIDRFSSSDLYNNIFLSEGQIYLSSIVLMELRAGAHTKQTIKAVNELRNFFKRLNRIITPSLKDYDKVGEAIVKLQSMKGYTIKKCASITNDCLIATSAKVLERFCIHKI
ncbi:MAG: type II toxin-antitoxin system VapC family toxin [Candidatus Scalindua sp.]